MRDSHARTYPRQSGVGGVFRVENSCQVLVKFCHAVSCCVASLLPCVHKSIAGCYLDLVYCLHNRYYVITKNRFLLDFRNFLRPGCCTLPICHRCFCKVQSCDFKIPEIDFTFFLKLAGFIY